MGFLVDLHVHTRLYSPCSFIDPAELVRQAIRVGLDGLVITEHHYQWREDEIASLLEHARAPDFALLAGFEYASSRGDILIYGLSASEAAGFKPGMPPGEAVRRAHDLGGVCIGAHPTRASMGFDDTLRALPLDALEVSSMNLRLCEQKLAMELAAELDFRPVASSDAHQINNVGCYATEFDDPICSMENLQEAFRHGKFRPANNADRRIRMF